MEPFLENPDLLFLYEYSLMLLKVFPPGAMEGTRTPGLLIRSARRAIPSIFGSYVLASFLCDTSQVLSFEFLHPLSDFATICTLCTF